MEMVWAGDSPSELREGEIPPIKPGRKQTNQQCFPHLAAGLAQLGQRQQEDSEQHLPISV